MDQLQNTQNYDDQSESYLDPTQNLFNHNDDEKHNKNIMQDPEEFRHFKDVVAAFFNYKV